MTPMDIRQWVTAFLRHNAIPLIRPVSPYAQWEVTCDLMDAYRLEGAADDDLVQYPGDIVTVTTLAERDETDAVLAAMCEERDIQ